MAFLAFLVVEGGGRGKEIDLVPVVRPFLIFFNGRLCSLSFGTRGIYFIELDEMS